MSWGFSRPDLGLHLVQSSSLVPLWFPTCQHVHDCMSELVRAVWGGVFFFSFSFSFSLIPSLWNPIMWTLSLHAYGLRKSSWKVWTAWAVQVWGFVVGRPLIFGHFLKVSRDVQVGGRAINWLTWDKYKTLMKSDEILPLRSPFLFIFFYHFFSLLFKRRKFQPPKTNCQLYRCSSEIHDG